MKWFEIRAEANSDHAEILIYSTIGKSWYGDSVEAKKFVEELNALDVKTIALRINSPGGSVFDGVAIFNALVRHKAEVTTYIDGLAASIASVIALAGDKVVIAENAMFMIHDPWTLCVGNSSDIRKTADVLDKIASTMVRTYAKHSSLGEDEIKSAMAAETWYTADEAVEAGFADETTAEDDQSDDASALGDLDPTALFRNVPEQVAARFRSEGKRNSASDEALLRAARDNIEIVLGEQDPPDEGDDGEPEEDPAASGDTRATVDDDRLSAMLRKRFEEV